MHKYVLRTFQMFQVRSNKYTFMKHLIYQGWRETMIFSEYIFFAFYGAKENKMDASSMVKQKKHRKSFLWITL